MYVISYPWLFVQNILLPPQTKLTHWGKNIFADVFLILLNEKF